ncbi:AMP-binding protein [Lipingzhangella sp. LS1_29]|uniref:AMP-binding protein n=1 Tax=Lipingzhangella rawalii TaxID=2055835 RepID=A0ABU2H370_9ACTN|nr:AMP-binding protein [Lipingzhangella rawalii]MDS1269295.1 AMP-binding protein [Lipingzhangella rawalii]
MRAGSTDVTVDGSGRPATVLADLVYDSAEVSPEGRLLGRPGDGQWQPITATELRSEVSSLAKGFIAAGIGVGDRVGLILGNRHEWVLVSFALWTLGAVAVPLDPASATTRVRDVLRHCRPAAVLVEGDEHARIATECRDTIPDLGRVWRLDQDGLTAISRLGTYMESSAVYQRKTQTHSEHPATITYKEHDPGQVRTHGELLAEAGHVASEYLDPLLALDADTPGRGPAAVVHLPLWHPSIQVLLLACVLRQVYTGVVALEPGHPDGGGARTLQHHWQQFRPTLLLGLPAELQEIYRGARERAQRSGAETLHTFEAAAEIAGRFGATDRPGRWLRMRRAMNEWMYAKIREGAGGEVAAALSIGPLPDWLDNFLAGVGISTGQTPQIPGLEVLTAAQETVGGAAAFTPDPDAQPAETPRSGNEGGTWEWADPSVQETPAPRPDTAPPGGPTSTQEANRLLVSLIQAHPLIGHAVILDEGWPVRAVLVTVSVDELEVWRLDQGKPLATSWRALVGDPDLRSQVWSIVNQANGRVAPELALRDVTVLPVTFTVDNGYLDTSGHPDVAAVTRDFVAEISAMYRWHPLSD